MPGENFDSFIGDLRKLAKNSEIGAINKTSPRNTADKDRYTRQGQKNHRQCGGARQQVPAGVQGDKSSRPWEKSRNNGNNSGSSERDQATTIKSNVSNNRFKWEKSRNNGNNSGSSERDQATTIKSNVNENLSEIIQENNDLFEGKTDHRTDPVIGISTINDLKILKINQIKVNENLSEIIQENNDLFEGIGEIKIKPYQFKLKTNYKPHIAPIRQIPFQLVTPLKEELDSMVNDGIIAPITEPTENNYDEKDFKLLENDIELQVNLIKYASISPQRFTEIETETKNDLELNDLLKVVMQGWPLSKKDLPNSVKPYWKCRGEIYEAGGLLIKANQIIIPQKLRGTILDKLHYGHMGINKTILKAKEVVYWPFMTQQIADVG
ncbi:Integrase zinc binding domain [Popillia japonica]|uniref:RNA-directed DNA polymerase n=1 Tax=Popillia japonica TaxID=7064 RepID=A0AAW1MYV2_POPJA